MDQREQKEEMGWLFWIAYILLLLVIAGTLVMLISYTQDDQLSLADLGTARRQAGSGNEPANRLTKNAPLGNMIHALPPLRSRRLLPAKESRRSCRNRPAALLKSLPLYIKAIFPGKPDGRFESSRGLVWST